MGFYPVHSLIDEAKRHGVAILSVDVNRSDWDCTLEEVDSRRALRMGLRLTRSLHEDSGRALALERQRGGPFRGLRDFMNRVPLRSDSLHTLARADAFVAFGRDSRHLLWELLEHELLLRRDSTQGDQLGLFSLINTDDPQAPRSGLFDAMSPLDRVQADYETLGASHRAHPMQALRWQFKKLPRKTSREVKQGKTNDYITAAGLVLIRQRPPTAKGVVFATLEDEHGFLDLVLHKPVYERTREVFMRQCFLIVSGSLQRDLNTVSVLVRQVHPIWADPSDAPSLAQKVDTRTYFQG
jgi:error-prone DNA polymerase